jgi:hypothetical protein
MSAKRGIRLALPDAKNWYGPRMRDVLVRVAEVSDWVHRDELPARTASTFTRSYIRPC